MRDVDSGLPTGWRREYCLAQVVISDAHLIGIDQNSRILVSRFTRLKRHSPAEASQILGRHTELDDILVADKIREIVSGLT